MARLKALLPEEASGKTKELFDAVHRKFGVVPNMIQTMGNSQAVLEAYLSFSDALSKGRLNSRTGKLIAMAVAESNSCNYCLSIHNYLGENLLKIEPSILEDARAANSNDAKTDAILKFAKTLLDKKGLVSDTDVDRVKTAGVSEAEIGEIVGNVALNIFTNYFNNTAKTKIDFPLVEANQTTAV